MAKIYSIIAMLCVSIAFTPSKGNSQNLTSRGKDFWVGYQATSNTAGAAVMKLYLGSMGVGDSVRVAIGEGTPNQWIRNYWVPAHTTIETDSIPRLSNVNAHMPNEGMYSNRGIHITSKTYPILAYAHISMNASSGATMLLPVHALGYENYILTAKQYYASSESSAFHVIATEDSTWVEINPSVPTRGGWTKDGGTQPNGSYLVKLNKGDIYQVLGAIISGGTGYDLTGSSVHAVPNAQGSRKPIAVFSGSTRTIIQCTATGSNGDLIIQQVFPYHSWGKRFATSPFYSKNVFNASANIHGVYRVLVKDSNTIVSKNGVVLSPSNLIGGKYYEYESNGADYITSDQPVLVAQFMPSTGYCANSTTTGDPEMIYISPLTVAIPQTIFYRNTVQAIKNNFLNVVVPTPGLSTFKVDGIPLQNIPAADKVVYDHPNLPGYSVVVKKWVAAKAQCYVESNYAFTGITYGTGSVESYGYNLGAQFDTSSLETIKYNTIMGSAFLDKNSNGVKDSSEPYFTNGRFEIVKPGYDSVSIISSTGKFLKYVDTGNHVTRFVPSKVSHASSPVVHASSFSTYFNADTIHFAVRPVPGVRDLSIHITPVGAARPGFKATYRIKYANNGSDTAGAIIHFIKSNRSTYDSASLVPVSVVADTIKWTIPSLIPGAHGVITLKVKVNAPPAVNIGDTLHYTATISSNAADHYPADNTASLLHRVTNAYDPNDKLESHAGRISLPAIAAGEYLYYTIRFQNTGSDTAFNVNVRDTLDEKLDWRSMLMVGASHDYQLNVANGRFANWNFENIRLVDSNRNEPLSHGYITFMIKPKANVAIGDIISNQASIYFDHNLPIVTNTETTEVTTEALPVRLLNFTATRQQHQNLLQWRTTHETSFSHFEIERSADGRAFTAIATVAGGAVAYSLPDNTFERGLNYYRLKMVDRDGTYTYSQVRVINNSGKIPVTVFPNPARDILQVRVEIDKKTDAQVNILSLEGKVVQSRTVTLPAGLFTTGIDISMLPPGNYILKMQSPHSEPSIIKFTKQ